jgi:hypothetical protein
MEADKLILAARKKAAEELAAYENEQLQKKLKAEVDAHDFRIRKEMDAEKYGAPPPQIQSNPALMPS